MPKRILLGLLAAGFLSLAAPAVLAQTVATKEPACKYGKHGDIVLADPGCTPGVVATTDAEKIATTKWGKDKRNVTPAMKREVCASYGITEGCPGPKYEIDHRLPRCAGGADDVHNLWPQPAPQFHWKDQLEDAVCSELKKRSISVDAAQNIFLGDWSVHLSSRHAPIAEVRYLRACLSSTRFGDKAECHGPSLTELVCTGMIVVLDVGCGTLSVGPSE